MSRLRVLWALALSLTLSITASAEERSIAHDPLPFNPSLEAAVNADRVVADLTRELGRLKSLHPTASIGVGLSIEKDAHFAASSTIETGWGGQRCVIRIQEELLVHLKDNPARMAFTLAHEFAHCLNGDNLSRTATQAVNPMMNWRQEYRADLSAALMLKKLGYEVKEGSEILNFLGSGCTKTHPSIEARRRALESGQQASYRECMDKDVSASIDRAHEPTGIGSMGSIAGNRSE